MDSPVSPSGSLRRHGRNISQPLVRRKTRGPLDAVEDRILQSASVASHATPTARPSTPLLDVLPGAPQSPVPPPVYQPRVRADIRFLQDSRIYHALPTDDIPQAFLNSPHQPHHDAQLLGLLQGGHFRRGATVAVSLILQSEPDDAETVLRLLYTRLACLVLLARPDLATQEAIRLTEVLARNSPTALDLHPIVPWELRLLLVHLQSLGASDGGRRGIMALYALAGEVRTQIRVAQEDTDSTKLEVLRGRLHDLGLRVADALVEMGELETAGRHLGSLPEVDMDDILYRKALLRLRVGDVIGTKAEMERIGQEPHRSTLEALIKVADGDFPEAEDSFRKLAAQQGDNALAAHNLAICALYTGHIVDSRAMLEDIIHRHPPSGGMLFNLSTIYELCSERAVDQKMKLVENMAKKTPDAACGGWERANFEFKL